jgi:two-component system, OmpR family, sensor kinase
VTAPEAPIGVASTPRLRTAPTQPARWAHWIKPGSIRLRLSVVFALFLLLVIGLGAFGIQRLAEVNRVSDEIRNHWLQDTRLLGDLNNYMSDYRTAEGTHLLSTTPGEIVASEKEIASLDATVSRSQRGYESIPQDSAESAIYDEFAEQWAAYKEIASEVLALSRAGQKAEAVRKYMTMSRRAFDISSDTLGRLTDQTVARAHEATERAAVTYQRARTLIIAAMLVATCLLVAAIVYITHSISNPLLELSARMHALAGHNTNVTISGARRGDEIGEMARSVVVFRDNAVALMATQRRLLEQAATLEAALDSERRLTAQQDNFVAMTSHEFRTPLTVIDGQAQRLIKMKDRLDPADIAERGARIRSAVLRMTSIMDGLLGASRLLDGEGVFHPTEVKLGALLREICQLHREMTHGAIIHEDFEDLPDTIEGDPKLLFHAVSNLVSNAVKYSPPGSLVELSTRTAPNRVILAVRDRGMGIPERDREHLFERYFRGGNATGIAGTGVGLHLVAMVLKLHDGSIEVESREGVGSTFVMQLPIRRFAATAQPVPDRIVV